MTGSALAFTIGAALPVPAVPAPTAPTTYLGLPEDAALPAPAEIKMYEDDRHWDCRVMGNRACGVGLGLSTLLAHYQDGLLIDLSVR